MKCGKVKFGAVVLKVLVEQMQQQCYTGPSLPYAAYLWYRPLVTFLDRVVVWNTLRKILNGRNSTQISDLRVIEILHEMSRNFE
jgi:hypothetical protein